MPTRYRGVGAGDPDGTQRSPRDGYADQVVVILMGVAGSGKTTIGSALAKATGWRFIDADDFHSAAAVAKMHAGVPLTDEDRAAWLAVLHDRIARALDRREHAVLACSALKSRYRQTLQGSLRGVRFVYLAADAETLARRLAERSHHFAGPSLLASQLTALEAPTDALALDATRPPEQIVEAIRREFGI
jgi:gluconokinase